MINDTKLAVVIKKSNNIMWQKKDGDLYFSDGHFAIKISEDRFNKYCPKTRGVIYERFGGFNGKESQLNEFFTSDNLERKIINTNLSYLDNKIFAGEDHYTFVNEKLISIIKDLKKVKIFNKSNVGPVHFVSDVCEDRALIMPVRAVEGMEYLKGF